MSNIITPVDALLHWQQKHPQRVYLRQPIDGVFHEKTWAMVAREVGQIASGILAQGIKAGDKVALLAKNSSEWFIADMAITMAGCVSVPIYATANADTTRYVLEHSESKLLFVGKLDKWQSQQAGVPDSVIKVAMPYPTMPASQQWAQWLDDYPVMEQPYVWQDHDIMTVVYTSGSTGQPKGAQISFSAFRFASERLIDQLGAVPDDRTISYLPLAHITERVFVQGTSIYHGHFTVSFVESLATFADNVRSVEPTMFLSVPRLWMRFQHGIYEKIPPKKLYILLAIPFVSSLVKRKIRQALGLNKARVLGCGSAPVPPSLLRWYQRIGLNVSEAWGMTENLAFGTLNVPFIADKVGTIGKPGDGVEIKISTEGEILIRSLAMMTSYYKEPELSAETIKDGWLHSGDKGEIDADGCVKIIGRIKESFKTAKGKYVAPVPIEKYLLVNSMIEQVCVVGSALTQPVALVVLADEVKALQQEQIITSLERSLEIVNAKLESHARMAHIVVVKDEWNVENTMLTPTLKIRRSYVEQYYHDLVNREMTEKVVIESSLS